MTYELRSPEGTLITGTLEQLSGMASIGRIAGKSREGNGP